MAPASDEHATPRCEYQKRTARVNVWRCRQAGCSANVAARQFALSPPGWHTAVQIAELRLAFAYLLFPRLSISIVITDVDVLRVVAEHYLLPRFPNTFQRVHSDLEICNHGAAVAVRESYIRKRPCCRTAVFGDRLAEQLAYAEFRLSVSSRSTCAAVRPFQTLSLGVVRSDFDPTHDRANDRDWLSWQYFLRNPHGTNFQREPKETKPTAAIVTKWMGVVPVQSGDVVGLMLNRNSKVPFIKAYHNGVYIGAVLFGDTTKRLHDDLCWALEIKGGPRRSEMGIAKVSVQEFPPCQVMSRNSALRLQASSSTAPWTWGKQIVEAMRYYVVVFGWALETAIALRSGRSGQKL